MVDLPQLPEAPEWFASPPVHLFKSREARELPAVKAMDARDDEVTGRARRTLDKLTRDLASTMQGGRNEALNKAAYTMAGLIAAGAAIDRTEVEQRLRTACDTNGFIRGDGARAFLSTFESGFRSGLQRPMPIAEEIEEGEPQPPQFNASEALEALTHPGGLVGEIIDWCEATSERPSRAAALGPALGFVATLAGRRFASESDARTNLYMLTLAESGFGKDHARQAIKRLATKAVLQAALGAGRIMSTTALRNALLERPAQFLMVDEFHGTMAMVTDKRNPYARLLGDDLLELFASASTYFSGAAYASTPAVNIQNPNLSIYGTSTPDAFWPAAGSQSVTNGLLARFILFNVEGVKPAYRMPTTTLREVPVALVSACQELSTAGGNLQMDGGTARPAAIVPYDDDGRQVLNSFREFIEAREVEADSRQRPFLNRAVEHAIKLALTVAVGVDPANPIITGAVMDWARRLAWHSTCSLVAETRDRIADSQREADYNRILKLIKDAGTEGLKQSAIPDRTRNIDERRRSEILRDLTISGRVRLGPVQTKRGTRERYIFIR